jgi:hypothetical protein
METEASHKKHFLVFCVVASDDPNIHTYHSHTSRCVTYQSTSAPDKQKVSFDWHPELGCHPELGRLYLNKNTTEKEKNF